MRLRNNILIPLLNKSH